MEKITKKIKPLPGYMGVGFLATALFNAEIPPDNYDVKKLKEGVYEITLENAPSNWKQILSELGEIV